MQMTEIQSLGHDCIIQIRIQFYICKSRAKKIATYFMDGPLRDIFGVEIWLGDAKQVASRSATLVKTNLDKKE